LKRADWVISNDSGPMHLAAALGVRTLGIFGPTDEQGTRPMTPKFTLVRHECGPPRDSVSVEPQWRGEIRDDHGSQGSPGNA